MEWLTVFLGRKKKIPVKTVEDNQREALVEQGRAQFQQLLEKGLGIPSSTFINKEQRQS